jgi:hypothetical protein
MDHQSNSYSRTVLPLWRDHIAQLFHTINEPITHISASTFDIVWEAMKNIQDISADEIEFVFTEIMLRALIGRMIQRRNMNVKRYAPMDLENLAQFIYSSTEPKFIKYNSNRMFDMNTSITSEEKDDVKERMKKLADYTMIDELDVITFFEKAMAITEKIPLFFESAVYYDTEFSQFIVQGLSEESNHHYVIQNLLNNIETRYQNRPLNDPLEHYWEELFDWAEVLNSYEQLRGNFIERIQRVYFKSFEPDRSFFTPDASNMSPSDKKMNVLSSKIFNTHQFLLPKRMRAIKEGRTGSGANNGIMSLLLGDVEVNSTAERSLEPKTNSNRYNSSSYPDLPNFKIPKVTERKKPEDDFISIRLSLSILRYCDALVAYSMGCPHLYHSLIGLSLSHYQAFPITIGLGFMNM